MEKPTIRTYAPADRAGVVTLWNRCFPDDPPRSEPNLMIDRKLKQKDGFFWVAEDKGVIVGAVMAGYDGVRGWIYHLATLPECRGQGVARALLDEVKQTLLKLGCPKINLQVRESNAGVVAFYEACGYKRDATLSMGMTLDD